MRGSGALSGCLLVAAMALSACAGADGGGAGDDIRVGMIFAQTGEVSALGVSARVGAVAAVDKINAAGGVDGRKLAVSFCDDGGDVARVVVEGGEQPAQRRERVRHGAPKSSTVDRMIERLHVDERVDDAAQGCERRLVIMLQGFLEPPGYVVRLGARDVGHCQATELDRFRRNGKPLHAARRPARQAPVLARRRPRQPAGTAS